MVIGCCSKYQIRNGQRLCAIVVVIVVYRRAAYSSQLMEIQNRLTPFAV
jgi:hypothetical protein